MKKCLLLIITLSLVFPVITRAQQKNQDEIVRYLQKAYMQKRKDPRKAILLGLIPSLGHAYIGNGNWSNRGIFFLLGETAAITVSATLGYHTSKRSIGPGVYEDYPNQPTIFLYLGIFAASAIKVYELWDINTTVKKYNDDLKKRFGLTFSNQGPRTKFGLVFNF